MEHGFTWLGLFPAIPQAFQSNVTAALIALLVVLGVMKIKGRLATDSDEALLPDDRLSLRNVFELLVEGVRGLANNVIGHDGDKYLPLLGTIFIYILAMNLIGLVPGFSPPTSDFNVNMGMAATVFLLYNFYGFREHGPAYLKQFLGPIIWLAPLMLFIELMSHVFRPVSLTLRLFGNMNGDHLVVGVFTDLVPILVPVVFLCLGLLVCMIQALVFTVLSAVYIALAVSHAH